MLDDAQIKRAIVAIESGVRPSDVAARFGVTAYILERCGIALKPKEKVYMTPESERERQKRKRAKNGK
jgi:hypothetical protein